MRGRRRKPIIDQDFQIGIKAMVDTLPVPKEWTIINALNRVMTVAQGSGMPDEFWTELRAPLDFLNEKLGLTDIQIVVVGSLIEEGEAMSWRSFAEFLNCSRISMMTWTEEINDLIRKGWIINYIVREIGGRFKGFKISDGVIAALRNNECYVQPKIDNLSLQEFMDHLEVHIDKGMRDDCLVFEDDVEWLMNFVSLNQSLPLCQAITGNLSNKFDIALFLFCLADYAQWADSSDEGLHLKTMDDVFPDEMTTGHIRRRISDGSHILLQRQMLEYDCTDGMANPERLKLTRSVKEKLLDTYVPSKSRCQAPKKTDRYLRSHSQIAGKELFYNKEEERQIERLGSLLSQDNFMGVQERLAEMGMRKGFAAIFYGAPGTGKTETVLQLAKTTGRDIMQIDLAAMRDKWVGESEKNIKGVFVRYRELCRNCETTPILLFNEADAIFGRRNENAVHSVDKMNNAMQNIILQEMEDLEGIMIATTNMACSLDAAFERRFLFKVEFRKPEKDVKAKIWNHMFKNSLSPDEVEILSRKYDFAGGQIENIVRKSTIDYILDGHQPQFNKLCSYCDEELLSKSHAIVGFAR